MIREFKAYLDGAHSSYHAVAQLVQMLENDGYFCLPENQSWELIPGEKYYMTRGMSSLVAFRIPERTPTGFMMTAAHSDRPSFKLKEDGELTGEYLRASVEKYGGSVLSTWLDRPLSVAGRVVVETPNGIESKLIDIDRDLLLIPNVAIHMERTVNDGKKWNPAVDLLPLAGDGEKRGELQALLERYAGGSILGSDLYLYVRQPASVWGVAEEYISAQGLDDLACVWCCAQGFLGADDSSAVPVLCVFDHEEVGSGSPVGADSQLLAGVLHRICDSLDLDEMQMLSQSFLLSADNAHALHPNHPEYGDAHHAPKLNGGVVLKYHAGMNYTTDGVSAGLFRKICEMADVPVQIYYNRGDLPGGSTLGRLSAAHVSVPTADIGLAQLAMHSCYETLGVQDVASMADAVRTYYGCALENIGDGSYELRWCVAE